MVCGVVVVWWWWWGWGVGVVVVLVVVVVVVVVVWVLVVIVVGGWWVCGRGGEGGGPELFSFYRKFCVGWDVDSL